MVKLKQFKMDKKPIQINMSTHSSADELETCCKLFQDTLIKFNEIKQAKKKRTRINEWYIHFKASAELTNRVSNETMKL